MLIRTKLKSTMAGEVSKAIPEVLLKGKLETLSVSRHRNSLLWYKIIGNHKIIAHIASPNIAKSTRFPIKDWKRFSWSLSDVSLLFTQSTKTGYDLRFRNVVNGSVRVVRFGETPSLINEYTEPSLSASDTARFNIYDSSGIS